MKVLINRTDAIGDTLLSIPLGRFIKYHYPEAEICFIVSPRSNDLIPLCVGVDRVFTLNPKDSKSEKKAICNQIIDDYKPTHFFHLGGDFTPIICAFWKRIPFRGGLVSKLPTFFYLNRGVRQSRSQVEKHESEYNLDLAAPMNLSWDQAFLENHRDELSPKFVLEESKRNEVKAELESHLQGRKALFIHPGMSGHTLNWPNEYYGELANRLYDEFRETHKVVVSFTPSDLPYVEGMKASLRPEVLDDIYFFDGSVSGLVHFTYILSCADLFIGPSTGTTHMANALRLKQVALYSPIKVQSEKRWGPFFRGKIVDVFSPATESMSSISVEEVFQSIKNLIK